MPPGSLPRPRREHLHLLPQAAQEPSPDPLPLPHRRGRCPSAHLRHHLASGCRQDHADREAAAVRRGHPSGRRGQGQGRAAAGAVGLDEDRAAARDLGHHLGDDVRVCRLHLQPAGHAGPRRLQRGHLPDADGGRLRDHGAGCRQGHRAADLEAVRGLPAARHPDHDLHQQDGPRGQGPGRAAGRDPRPAGAGHRADELADRHGPELQGRVRPAPAGTSCCWARATG